MLQAEVDSKNVELKRQSEAKAARRIAAEQARNQELDELFAEVYRDPVIVHLLQAVVEITKERKDTVQRLDDLSEAMGAQDYAHSEAMARIETRLSEQARKAQEAEREAERARNEAEDAALALRKAKQHALHG